MADWSPCSDTKAVDVWLEKALGATFPQKSVGNWASGSEGKSLISDPHLLMGNVTKAAISGTLGSNHESFTLIWKHCLCVGVVAQNYFSRSAQKFIIFSFILPVQDIFPSFMFSSGAFKNIL